MRKVLTAAAATMMATGAVVAGTAAPASAAPNIAAGNLVNVQISNVANNNDILNDVNVVVPINVAANICDLDVNVLATDLSQDGTATCTSRAGRDVTVTDA